MQTQAMECEHYSLKRPASCLDMNRTWRRKSVENAKQHAKDRKLNTLLKHVNSWIHESQPPLQMHHFIEVTKCIKRVLELSGHGMKDDILLSSFIYAERYVQKRGRILPAQLVNLLLISSIVAVKFWVDVGDVDLKEVGKVMRMDVNTMKKMERVFLSTLEYRVFLTAEDLEEYLNPSSEASS